MFWSRRETGGLSGRCALIAACAVLVGVAGEHPRRAHAEPFSASPPAAEAGHQSFGEDQRAEELYLDGVENV